MMNIDVISDFRNKVRSRDLEIDRKDKEIEHLKLQLANRNRWLKKFSKLLKKQQEKRDAP
tara:strand:+ start:505 stop:684 length:180 start_codon:yes stop_codon:yes gene_type:complete